MKVEVVSKDYVEVKIPSRSAWKELRKRICWENNMAPDWDIEDDKFVIHQTHYHHGKDLEVTDVVHGRIPTDTEKEIHKKLNAISELVQQLTGNNEVL